VTIAVLRAASTAATKLDNVTRWKRAIHWACFRKSLRGWC